MRKHAAFSLAILALGAVNAVAAMVAGKIEVGAVKGDVKAAFASGGSAPLAAGAVLNAGAKVVSGANSTVELYFANGAKVVVQPATELQIRKFTVEQNGAVPTSGFNRLSSEPSFSVTEISVPKGKVVVEVLKLNSASDFKVQTPMLVTSVEGTAYSVEQADLYAKVACVEGLVAVQPRVSVGAPVKLSAKQSVVYRISQSNNRFDGYFEAVQEMPRNAVEDVVAQLERGGSESDSGEEVGAQTNLDSEDVIDHSLILVSPVGP